MQYTKCSDLYMVFFLGSIRFGLVLCHFQNLGYFVFVYSHELKICWLRNKLSGIFFIFLRFDSRKFYNDVSLTLSQNI